MLAIVIAQTCWWVLLIELLSSGLGNPRLRQRPAVGGGPV
jgi:hypothetical protein